MKRDPRSALRAFTLIELMIVVGLIALALTIALPTMVSAVRAGADKQTENIVASYCSAAQVLAAREGKYACVHHQVGTGSFAGGCYIAIFLRDPTTGLFRLAPGFDIQRLPGGMCLGEVSTATVSGSAYIETAVSNPDQFTCFSVVFSPSGKVVTGVEGGNVKFDQNDPTFVADPNTQVWSWTVAGGAAGEAGASAMTLFEYAQYMARPTGTGTGTRVAYINENGAFLPVNVHTGQLYPRK